MIFKTRRQSQVVVSLTSYPARINNLQPTLNSIFKQTRPADKIVLWLATTEFANKEADLPNYLTAMVQSGQIVIEWCKDLKPHKKYFYALQKYRTSIVITIDDDLLFEPDMIECLLASYARFPRAVSAMRTHLMEHDGDKFVPYQQFINQQNLLIGEPSMRLLATNGAGSLFPPNLLKRKYFQEKLVEDMCLYTDDLWLKAMEVLSDVMVVQPRPFNRLQRVENSQNTALWHTNVLQGRNDKDLEKIQKWADGLCGNGYFFNRIFYTNDTGSFYQKFVGHNTVLYFVPHQDDELLSMGIDICTALAKGKNVQVILCTDGAKSGIRKVLGNKGGCKWHQGKHVYDLSEEAFSKARDAEFTESCRALGVPQENIHFLPVRASDGTLDVGFTEAVIMHYLAYYGAKCTVCAIHFDNGETQHRDHKALGQAVYNLWQRGLIYKVRFFCEPYCQNEHIHFIAKSAPQECRPKLAKAIWAYSYWNPAQGRYAVGYHSVAKDFDDFERNMQMYYFKLGAQSKKLI